MHGGHQRKGVTGAAGGCAGERGRVCGPSCLSSRWVWVWVQGAAGASRGEANAETRSTRMQLMMNLVLLNLQR